MRPAWLAMALVGGLLWPWAPGGLSAQAPSGGCLAPLPSPQRHLLKPTPDPPLSESRAGSPSYFVSSVGRLCEVFRPGGDRSLHTQAIQNRLPQPGKASLFSAFLPGSGQKLLGQDRWIAYAAVEAWAWVQFFSRRNDGKNLQGRFRDLSWLVARRVSTGPRVEAGWDYYEALTHFQASGAYDSDPLSPGVQPEGDSETFNGSIWALAQEIFLPEDPEIPVDAESGPYQKAQQYYLTRAYPQNLAWNWGSNSLHQAEYTSLIRASDENLRRSTTMIGVIVANHLLSAVDALVSGRLALAREEEARMELSLEPGPFRTETLVFRVRLPAPISHDP